MSATNDLSQQNNSTLFDGVNYSKELNCTVVLDGTSGPPPYIGDVGRYIISAILFLCPCLTVFGNGMVIVAVLTHKRLQTVTNAFVVSLAVADIMVAILVMPFGIYQQFNNKVWNLGRTWCLITTSFDVMFTTSSIFHLSGLAIDRYLAICRPFVHEKLTRSIVILMLIGCWVVPIFISFLPIMNNWNQIGIHDFIECAFPYDNPLICAFIVNEAFATVCSLIAFYIPTVFIVMCNVYIFRAARTQARRIRSLELASHEQRNGKLLLEKKAAKTMSIIMGCFFICWLPFFVLNIIDPFIGYKTSYNLWTVALWLGYINSMFNPILYYKFNTHFKLAIRRLFSCKVCRGVSEFSDDFVTNNVHTEMVQSISGNFRSCFQSEAERHTIDSSHI